MSKVLRLCLDLNIWCAALLAEYKQKQDTACQSLVKIVRDRDCSLGKVQLVISWGMLNRLEKVLKQDWQVGDRAADLYLDIIRNYAQGNPQLTLGGTGIVPLRDTEDAHVLETALAGKVDILVTANFRDFVAKDTQVLISQRYGVHVAPSHIFQIVHPYLMMEWLNDGKTPDLSKYKS